MKDLLMKKILSVLEEKEALSPHQLLKDVQAVSMYADDTPLVLQCIEELKNAHIIALKYDNDNDEYTYELQG